MENRNESTFLKTVPYDLTLMKDILKILYKELNLAVIYGGNSQKDNAVLYRTYNPRHWKSYKKVSQDIKNVLEEIGFENVFLMSDDMALLDHLKEKRIHMAWLNTAGVQGQNSIAHAPTFLEQLGISYIGHNPLNYSIMDHKVTFKWILKSFGFRTPDFFVWGPPRTARKITADDKGFFNRFQRKEGPWVVKPVRGRGSKFIHFATTIEEVNDAIFNIYNQTYDHVLVEEHLPGREFCVSVGPQVIYKNGKFQRNACPLAFSFLERLFSPGEMIFASLDQKPIDSKRARSILDLEHGDLVIRLSQIGHQLFRKLNLNYLVRLDLREDAQGNLHILEVNPKPDLKQPEPDVTSLVAMGLAGHGMTYKDLIFTLLGAHLDYLFTFVPPLIQPIKNILDEAGLDIMTAQPARFF